MWNFSWFYLKVHNSDNFWGYAAVYTIIENVWSLIKVRMQPALDTVVVVLTL